MKKIKIILLSIFAVCLIVVSAFFVKFKLSVKNIYDILQMNDTSFCYYTYYEDKSCKLNFLVNNFKEESIPINQEITGNYEAIKDTFYSETFDGYIALLRNADDNNTSLYLLLFDEHSSCIIDLPQNTSDVLIDDDIAYLLIKDEDAGFILAEYRITCTENQHFVEFWNEISDINCSSASFVGKNATKIVFLADEKYYYVQDGIITEIDIADGKIISISDNCYLLYNRTEKILSVYCFSDNSLVFNYEGSSNFMDAILINDQYLLIGDTNYAETIRSNFFIKKLTAFDMRTGKKKSCKLDLSIVKFDEIKY